MSNYEIKNKAVSFNVLDPDQEALLRHSLKRKNFSAYVKRLIQRDLDGVVQTYQPPPLEQETPQLNNDYMENLI